MTAEVTGFPLPDPRTSDLDLKMRQEIKARMTKRGMTQARVGAELGEGQAWVSRRLRHPAADGAVPLDIVALQLIAGVLRTTVSELVAAAEESEFEAIEYRRRDRGGRTANERPAAAGESVSGIATGATTARYVSRNIRTAPALTLVASTPGEYLEMSDDASGVPQPRPALRVAG